MIDFGNGFGLNDIVGFATTLFAAITTVSVIWMSTKKLFERNFDDLRKEQRNERIELKRVEILSAIYHTPDDDQTIYTMLDAYFRDGGNSYIHDAAREWEKSRKKFKNNSKEEK